MKDFLLALALESADDFTKHLPPMPLKTMDECVDLRPPLALVLKVIGEDRLPSWLRKPLTYWQGPKPNVKEPCEGHFANLVIPSAWTAKLTKIAKANHVTMNGLLSALFLAAESSIAQAQEYSGKTENGGAIPIKYLFPVARAVRDIAKVSADQVGVFLVGNERIFNILPNMLTNHQIPSEFWKLAQDVTTSAREDVRDSIQYTGLLNFIPTPYCALS